MSWLLRLRRNKIATLYLKSGGGNYTDATTWSNVNAAGVDNSGPPTNADDCIAELASGNLTISAASTSKTFSTTAGTGNWAGVLTHNAFVWTVAGSITFNAGITYTPLATSTVTLSASNTLTSTGKLFPLMILNTGITTTLGDNLSFMASKVLTLILNGNSLDLNGKTISGNSATNRLLIRSNTLGTARTITISSGTFDASDFRDITAATSLDLSGVTNYSGDCGGNTSLTFTTAATQTATGNSANYSAATWTSRVPLPQDDVVISLTAGQTLTFDMPRIGKSLSVTTAVILSTNTIAQTIYGSLNLTNVATFTTGSTGNWTFEGRGTFNLTSAGQIFASVTVTFSMINGTMTLLDSFSQTTTNGVLITAGILDANGFNVTARTIAESGGITPRGITMGTGTWTATTTGNSWNFSSSTSTVTANTSTIALTAGAAGNINFQGGGHNFYNLSITGGGAGTINISGSNTFANLPQVIGGAKTLVITPGTTQTFTGGTNFGNGSNLVTINTGGAAATFTKPSGAVINATSISLTNIQATQTNKWYAGPTPPSVDGGGNTNWIFLAAPSGSGFGKGRFGQSRFGRLPFGTQAFHG